MSGEWTDKIAGARMQVDQRFTDRVLDSQFSNQQWGLIMTAVDFEVQDPEDPDEARLVANTEKVSQILPELENVPQGAGGPPGGGRSSSSSGGILDRLGRIFRGDGSDVDEEKLAAAIDLVDEYAAELQAFLEDQGRWEDVCAVAATSDGEN
jgi:hypothetical protein